MAGSGSGDVFDVRRIRRLIALMKEHDLVEIDLSQGDQRIKLKGAGEPGQAAHYVPLPAPAAPPAGGEESSAEETNIAFITSEMIGTFYTSPNPEAPPYVKVGDHIDPESTVCIIEAMKVFNEIPAGISGKIVAVLAQNGSPVEHGQRLFKVDTSG